MNNLTTQVIEAAERIRLRLQRSSEDVAAIGHDLIVVHEMLGAERFQEWIEEEFEMSRSAAYRFMQVAKKVPNPTVGLSATALYELAASPDSVIEEVTARAEEGEVIPPSEIRRLREQVREAEAETEEPPPQHKVTNGKARASESHSTHDAEVMALLVAWDAARPSARNAFLSVSGLMRKPQDAADLSDVDGHLHTEQPAPESNAEGADQPGGAGAAEREGDRRGDRAGGETSGAPSSGETGASAAPKRDSGAAEKRGSLEDWPEIPASLRRVA